MRKLAVCAGFVCGLALGCPGADDTDTTASSADSGQTDTTAGDACPLEQPANTSDGSQDPVMDAWGAPCSTDADCVALLGDGAVCDNMAVIYELPGNYCTKPCSLPDTNSTFFADDPACDPNGGVDCVGQKPIFERCAKVCNDDAQCNRDGYYCRRMPMISNDGDPTYCLMPDCCQECCEKNSAGECPEM
jgi:hypothetical protein